MKSSAAARRYARALFSLAQEDHRSREVLSELDLLAELFEMSPELREALVTPLYPVRERRAVLLAVADRIELSGIVKNFFAYLIDRRRMVDFAGIKDEFVQLVDEESGIVTAHVVTASELDERRRDRLRRALSERTGREVRLEVEVDPALIGGAVAKVGDLIFDGSIRTQLEQLRTNLTKGS
jgi:F-type H+-transporting ATPase subunit delta